MKHPLQLYLDDGQYRWLKRRAGQRGSVAQVVRDLIDEARRHPTDPWADPLVRYLLEEAPPPGEPSSSVTAIDHDLYGKSAPHR